MRRGSDIEVAEDFQFQLDVFSHGLNGQVHDFEVGNRLDREQAVQDAIGGSPIHLSLVDSAGQPLADGGLGFLGQFAAKVGKENRVPRGGGHLSDARSHLPGSHNAHFLDIHGSSFSCSFHIPTLTLGYKKSDSR